MTIQRAVMMIAVLLAFQSRPTWAGEPARGPGTQHPIRDEALRRELLRMAEEDLTAGNCKPPSPSEQWLCLPLRDIRWDNQIALERIIAEHGWPGLTLVGIDGQRAAWLIAQHADRDLRFQKNCLELVREAFAIGESEGYALAYLTDRVLENEGSPQMYGTQGGGVATSEDERRVDANRKAIGLEPWRVFKEKLQNRQRPLEIGVAP